MQRIKLIGLSSLLSVLIWAVADHSLTDNATLRVRLILTSGGGSDMHVSPLTDIREPFEVQVAGKKAIVSQLKAREPLTIRLPVSSRASGRYKLRLIDEFRGAETELSGVVIRSISPPDLDILVDRDKHVTLPVVVLPGTLDYEVPPSADPAQVQVTISELDYAQLDPADRRVVLDPDEHLRTAQRGKLLHAPVPLTPVVGGFSVQLDPDFVTLRYKLKEELQQATISAVPIKFEASLDIFNEFNVEVRDAGAILTRPVTIKGPADLVNRIESGEVKLRGLISLTAMDKADPGRWRYVVPRFDLPEGVELVGEPDRVEYRLVVRPGAEPALP
jgi:hypothetical protein